MVLIERYRIGRIYIMEYETSKTIICSDTNETYRVGDIVNIKFKNGGGCGGCRIKKITDTGFHFNQGSGRDKSVQYKEIAELY